MDRRDTAVRLPLPAQRRILLPVPSEAALVQRIFTLYADRRLGSAAISGLLNDAGQPTSRGRRWTPNRILGVLRNPTYIGQLLFNGRQHQASHEPIIDPKLFQRAQLPTSFLRCQRCGHGFVGTAAHGSGGTYRYYLLLAATPRHRPLRPAAPARRTLGGGDRCRGPGGAG